jgi:hypothetical protein
VPTAIGRPIPLIRVYSFHKDEFLKQYHKRSNVESTFSMVKRKFSDYLRSKSDAGMVNETLCKILCHNICCLIQSMYELKVDPVFWSESTPEEMARVEAPSVQEDIEAMGWM